MHDVPMNDYKEFTFGWMIFIFIVPIHALITYLYLNHLGNRPIETGGFIVISASFMIIYFLFYELTTRITSDIIIVSFGAGLIRKKIFLKNIQTVSRVKSPWYHGWGMRIIPGGTLYNISGDDAVELSFTGSGKVIRIGTKDSSILKKEIQRRISQYGD